MDRYNGNSEYEPKLASWSPESGTITKLGDLENPSALLTPDKRFAVIYNKLQYEPQFEYYAPADLSVRNCKTGATAPFLKKQHTASGMLTASPDSNYISFFRDGNWWVYDINRNQHRNLTKGLPASFINKLDDYSGPVSSYSSPGWSADSKYLIAYDEFDIWLLSVDGTVKRKTTSGRKDKTRYRIHAALYQNEIPRNPIELHTQSFDLDRGLILEMVSDSYASGYGTWKFPDKVTGFVFGDAAINRLQKAKESTDYIFIQQTTAMPPKLMHINPASNHLNEFMQSNPHFVNFESATAELMRYKNTSGDTLKGILYKPSDYQPGKKYPMVVFIYETLSQGLHQYYNLTEYQSMGFTPANYYHDGYLVLYPDIKYKLGAPGLSAVDCVESAVDAVKEMGIVEENHIGIIGHSFGGYEVSFIITQTNTFAAAISGSGVMDLVSSYFTHASTLPRSNAWRFESQQYRMVGSPFDDWKGYEQNSPLPNAAKITTPLFSWAGKNDPSVNWTQSVALHLAMRRLKKKNVFLLFPKEIHNVIDRDLQKMLSAKTKNWFDFYLKGKPGALINGMP